MQNRSLPFLPPWHRHACILFEQLVLGRANPRNFAIWRARRRRRRRKGVSYERPTRHGSEKKEGRAKFDFCESRKGSRVAAWNKSGKLTQTSTVVVLCIFKSLLFHLLECVSKWAGHATKDPLCKGPRGTSHFLEGHKLQENILPRQWGPFQLSRGMSASEQ